MRIISGFLKGRRYDPPVQKWPTRPTTDRAKEGLFNTLMHRMDFEDVRVLELFGGTGNISFEFLSRGCRDVTLVDDHRDCIDYVRDLAEQWRLSDYLVTVRSDALMFLETYSGDEFNVIFADPPYDYTDSKNILELVFDRPILTNPGLFVMEHDKRQDFDDHPNWVETREYGSTQFSFFYRRDE